MAVPTLPNSNVDPKSPDQGGEGDIDADRRYRAGVEKTVSSGQVEELAEEAKQALDGPEGEALRKAEQKGKDSEHKPV